MMKHLMFASMAACLGSISSLAQAQSSALPPMTLSVSLSALTVGPGDALTLTATCYDADTIYDNIVPNEDMDLDVTDAEFTKRTSLNTIITDGDALVLTLYYYAPTAQGDYSLNCVLTDVAPTLVDTAASNPHTVHVVAP